MKKALFCSLFALLLAVPKVHAQAPPFTIVSGTCIGNPDFGSMPLCYDTTLHTWNYWNGTTFVVISNGTSTLASPLILQGTSSGDIHISSGATPTTYTLTLKSTVPAQGDLVTYSNGTGQQASVADVATGQVLTSGGVGTVPAYSASPSITSATVTGSVDKTLNVSNGGHISSLLGTGTVPTVGTGSVASGGTDNAMEVTGATSPATVTFGVAFAAKPICTCTDETSALGACKVVPNANGATAVVTTTGTDSFMLLCLGK